MVLTVKESSTSTTEQTLEIEKTNRPPSTTSTTATFTTKNSTTSTSKIKTPNCKYSIKTVYNRGKPVGWYMTKGKNCTIT